MYIQIVKVLWKQNIPGSDESAATNVNGRKLKTSFRGGAANKSVACQLKGRRKAAKMLIAVVVMFGVCFLPVHVIELLR
ncbi:Uncharacterised protein g5612 [Pycnogonum litorale]